MSDYYLGVDKDGNVIMHSKGAWKKHKYIQKIGEGANAVYKYAKDKVGVTALEELNDAQRAEKVAWDWKARSDKEYINANAKEFEMYKKLNETGSAIRNNSSTYVRENNQAKLSRKQAKSWGEALNRSNGKDIVSKNVLNGKKVTTSKATAQSLMTKNLDDAANSEYKAKKAAESNKQNRTEYKTTLKNYQSAQSKKKIAVQNYNDAYNNWDKADEKLTKAYKKYYSTPLGKLDDTIYHGKAYVETLLSIFKNKKK